MFSRIISFLFITSFFVDLPIAARADDPRFVNCNQPFECGKFTNLYYPFWGKNRPDYCGHPSFELECLDDDSVEIVIQTQRYNVLYINEQSSILRIAAKDTWNSYCPSFFHNISLPSYPFNSTSPLIQHIILAYGCPPRPATRNVYRFPCSINGPYSENYFWLNETMAPAPDFSRCNINVIIPIAQPLVSSFMNMQSTVENVTNEGFQVTYYTNATFCDSCKISGGQCGYDIETAQNACFCNNGSCVPRPLVVGGGDNKGKKLAIGLGAGFGSILLTCIGFIIYKRLKRKRSSGSSALISRDLSRDSSLKPDPEKGGLYFETKLFTYKELDEATNHFDSSKELGDGGFGTVYHGKLRDGRVVAVKRLFEHNYKRVEQFMNEIEILSRLRHQNLVSLYGCTSRHSRELLLVYEFVPNGTVADHLHGERVEEGLLTWPIRMSIAIQSADALAYLHASEIIHRDVKSNNILLDNNFHVKVADFGLSRLFPTDVTHVSTAPQGTPGYVDPEYYQCYQLTNKSDVYSFGVVLIELISSKPAVDIGRHRHEINLANMAVNRIHNQALHELVDPSLGYDTDYSVRNMITLVAELAFRCLQQENEMRPCMTEVLEILRGIEKEEYKKRKTDDMDTSAVARLLKTSEPLSPDTVTGKWPSKNTTPNTSG